MEFFDRKEEVLDVQLTQYGKYLLSVGKLDPVYYSFFDSDIDYDTQYQGDPPGPGNTPGPSENQKDTEDRLKETPRIKIIHSVDSVETTSVQIAVPTAIEVEVLVDAGEAAQDQTVLLPSFHLLTTKLVNIDKLFYNSYNDFLSETYGDIPYKYVTPEKQSTFGLQMPLGKSNYNSIYYPAFDLVFGKGKIKESKYYKDHKFGIIRIPQLEVEVTFETTVASTEDKNDFSIKDIVSIKDSIEPANYNYTKVSEDGTYIKVEEDYIYINLRELHSLEEKENFIIEVYEIEEHEVEHRTSDSGGTNDIYERYFKTFKVFWGLSG
jgi:hypothetical protein